MQHNEIAAIIQAVSVIAVHIVLMRHLSTPFDPFTLRIFACCMAAVVHEYKRGETDRFFIMIQDVFVEYSIQSNTEDV
jgi:hypothetical protein